MSEKEPRTNMFEGGNNIEHIPPVYTDLVEKIQDNPNSEKVWKKVIALAKKEEAQGGGSESYYSHIPLNELITVGEKLKNARLKDKSLSQESKQAQYDILAKKSSTGEYWYDIILGHVNDKLFAPVEARLGRLVEARTNKKKFATGLDLGSGLGNTLRVISPYCEKVIGVEQLPQLVKLAKKDTSMPKNVEIMRGNALNLKFTDETFDIVVSNGLTHYLQWPQGIDYTAEVSRVLKDGGRYLEAYAVENPGENLPMIAREYLTSAKALVVCLIDEIVSKVEHDPSSYGKEPWGFSEMTGFFSRKGVFLRWTFDSKLENDASITKTGVMVAEYIKDKKYAATIAKGGYSRTD